ncbi:hypothetical protein [Photobacterium jeanii]|uniref:hypothetical protein n=1 Tax=Photobacterium jeanii TaxID=858640 RepID=UPI000AD4CBF9|nr:hypothetical protein [Photobacterium jeanii]
MRPMTFARRNTRSPSCARPRSHAPRFQATKPSADIHTMPAPSCPVNTKHNEQAA